MIVIVDERDPEFTEYPIPIHLHESGYSTPDDITLDVIENGSQYVTEIFYGTEETYYRDMEGHSYLHPNDDILSVEIEGMTPGKMRRLARMLDAAADHLEQEGQ